MKTDCAGKEIKVGQKVATFRKFGQPGLEVYTVKAIHSVMVEMEISPAYYLQSKGPLRYPEDVAIVEDIPNETN